MLNPNQNVVNEHGLSRLKSSNQKSIGMDEIKTLC